MSNYNSLKTTIDANIKQNGRQEITGQILNSVLNQMVTTLGAGYQFAGVATTATNPGTPDAKVFYIANGKGTYTNFGGLEVTEDEVVVLYWDSSWHKVSTGIASQEKLTELESEVNLLASDRISLIEDILVSNDGIYQNQEYGATDFVSVSEGDILTFYNTIPSNATAAFLAFYDNEKNYIQGKQQSSLSIGIHQIEVPANANYVRVNYYTESKRLFFLSINSVNAKNRYDIAEGYSIPCTFTDYIEFDHDGTNVVVKFNNSIQLVSKYGNERIYIDKTGESYNIPEYSSLLYNIRSKNLEVVAFNATPTDKDNVLIAYNDGGNIIAGLCANLYISKSSKEYTEDIALNVGEKKTLNPFGWWCDAYGTVYEADSSHNGYWIVFDGYFGTIKVFGTKPLTYTDENGVFYVYIACYNDVPSVGNNKGFIGRATLVSDDTDGFEFSVPKGTKYILYTYEVPSYKDGSYIYTSQTLPIVKLIDNELNKKPSFKTLKNFNLVNVGHSIWWYDGNQLNESGFMGGVPARGYQTLLSENFEFKSITRYCYSGYALASIPTQQGIIEKFANDWQSVNNAIWTVDTIVNDWGLDVELGTPSDYENNTGFNTFYGALRVLRDKIISLSGNAVVVCANSLQDRGGDTENKVGYKPSQYALAMMYVAAKNNWYFVDQFNKGGITAENTVYTTLDGLHPNNFGYTLAVKPWIEQFNILQNIIG